MRVGSAALVCLVALGGFGCATDPRMPGPLASRPIVPEEDTGLVTLGAGVNFKPGNTSPTFPFDLRVGLGSGFGFRAPLILEWAWGATETWSVAISGGLTNFYLGIWPRVAEIPADPRRPARAIDPTGLSFGGGPAVRWRVTPELTLFGESVASARFFGVDRVSLSAFALLGAEWSFAPAWSLRISGSYFVEGIPGLQGDEYQHQLAPSGALVYHFAGFDVGLFAGPRFQADLVGAVATLFWTYLF